MITQADVVGIAPELASIGDASRFTTAIADIYAELDASLFGTSLDTIAKKLVAHRLTLQERAKAGGGRGPLTGLTLGPMSKTFAGPMPHTDVPAEYVGTDYGIQAWGLIRQFTGLPMVL